MTDIIGYTFFALFILFQFVLGIGFLVWGIKIGLPFLFAFIPAMVFGMNCFVAIYTEITSREN